MSRDRFVNRVVFVTGGGSGIGAAAARMFAAEGAAVAIADIDAEAATDVAASLPRAVGIALDIADRDAVESGLSHAAREFGGMDVIFNNAGIDDKQQRLHETDDANWQRIMRVNGDGFFNVLRAGIAVLLEHGGGAIVNTASTAALTAVPDISPYTFTKGGLVALTRSAALEYGGHGIRINAVAPGATWTPLLAQFIATTPDPAAVREQMEGLGPIRGMSQADDVANAVLFLASNEAARITGVTIPVDGGQTL
jgi:NAD(P)-dependent dehydrogenase (short-subunit alcohol dehydrogenase family)